MADNNYYGSDKPRLKQCSMDRLGVFSVAATIRRPAAAETLLTVVRQNLSKHAAPDIGLGIPCVGINTPVYENGGIVFEYQYEGYSGDPTESEIVCEIDGSDNEEPIETHPDFLSLSKTYGAVYDDSGQFSYFPYLAPAGVDGIPDANGKVRNPFAGLSRYESGGYVWRKRWLSITLPQEIFRRAFYIDTPTGSAAQVPPDLPNSQNWLKLAPQAKWRGNCWEIIEAWLASGRNGWLQALYGSPS